MTAWWHDLSERERRLIMAAGLVIAVALILFAVVRPLAAFQSTARADYDRAAQTYRRVVVAAASADGQNAVDLGAVRTTVTSTAERSGIVLNRISSEGGVIDVSVGSTQTARLYGWLTALEEQHSIHVRDAQIRLSNNDGVTARLSFVAGN